MYRSDPIPTEQPCVPSVTRINTTITVDVLLDGAIIIAGDNAVTVGVSEQAEELKEGIIEDAVSVQIQRQPIIPVARIP